MTPDLSLYRPGVGIILFNRAKLVFVGKRIDQRAEAWQMPQGGIDKGEDPRTAVFRELKEEVGTDKAEIITESRDWYLYDLPPELVGGKLWGGRYRGQRQKWFAMRFMGQDTDIQLDAHTPEFVEWKWAPLADLPTLIVPFKRKLYEDLVAEFSYLAR